MQLAHASSPVPVPDQLALTRTRAITAITRGWSGRLSLIWQFRWASLVVMAITMLIVGAWVSGEAETGAVNRTASLTALYVNSVLVDTLEPLATQPRLDSAQIATLNHLLRDTALGQRVVDFRIWSPAGEVLYSSTEALIGKQYPVSSKLARALNGWVVADLSQLDEQENAYLHSQSDQLLEVYAPVHEADGNGKVLGVVEFYQQPDEVQDQVSSQRVRSWTIVGAATLIVYLLLAGMVQRGSVVITRQQAALRGHVRTLEHLHDRLREAAGRTTTLNEQAMRRTGADLHAGPGQALALALLRLDAIHAQCDCGCLAEGDLATVRGAITDAMTELRAIAAGLRLPELEPLGTTDVIRRAVMTHERRTGLPVELRLDELPANVALATKVVLFRTLEEALSNARRHGQGAPISVRAWQDGGTLAVRVADRGPGFAADRSFADGHLGLLNSRERAELLGGRVHIESAPGAGTRLWIYLPITAPTDWQAFESI